MRQLGNPPKLDVRIFQIVKRIYIKNGIGVYDASSSTSGKDYLERIIGFIRGTVFTTAIFTENTRQTVLANIALELGFAALFGKPLVIVKSKDAKAPSDLTRTDWIEFDPDAQDEFEDKLGLAINEMNDLASHLVQMFKVSEKAPRMDCAHAFELVRKAFLLNGAADNINHAELILKRLRQSPKPEDIDDLHRLGNEISLFVKKARKSITELESPKSTMRR